jgi:hypothetical protein
VAQEEAKIQVVFIPAVVVAELLEAVVVVVEMVITLLVVVAD